MKTIKKIFSVFLSFLFTFSLFSDTLITSIFAESIDFNSKLETIEQKAYSTASIEDNFDENGVLITLNNKESIAFDVNSSTISCIKEIDNIKEIKDLTDSIGELVQTKIQLISGLATIDTLNDKELIEKVDNVNTDTFNRVLYVKLEEPSKQNVIEAIKKLENLPNVLYASPDYILTEDSEPNDNYYTSDQWNLDKIDLPEAWEVSAGNPLVKVGIIDSGIDSSHPEFAMTLNKSLCMDFTGSADVQDPNPTDLRGHGTMVAGVIGAGYNNSEGISGICQYVQLVSLKITESNGYATLSRVARAINFATKENIKILNLSLSWGEKKGDSEEECANHSVRNIINNYSGLLVCSAGNEDNNNDVTHYYPSYYGLDKVITVGASNSNDSRWIKYDNIYASNYGRETVDIFAPGDGIVSCFPTDICDTGSCTPSNAPGEHFAYGYHMWPGTSIATPHVTGVAALLLAKNPNLSAAQIKNIILHSSEPSPYLENLCVSGGVLNAYNALTYNINNPVHRNTYEYTGDLSRHKCTCRICGAITYENHTWTLSPVSPAAIIVTPQYLPEYACIKCGARTLTP